MALVLFLIYTRIILEEISNLVELVNQYPHELNDSIPFYSIGIHRKLKKMC
ncbi:MAG: hypothetical protein IPO23_07850 [Flavobacterium sp.]|nr:hypothetical protein [Flavobacterium sp.]